MGVFGKQLHAQRCSEWWGKLPGHDGDGQCGGKRNLSAGESSNRFGRRVGNSKRE
jgi:hypothetical protein